MTLWENGSPVVQWTVVIAAASIAAATDLSRRRIPNWLTIPLFLGGVIWATSIAGLAGLADSLVACVVLMVPYVLLYAFARGGAGDAKLMGAIGAWLGLINGLAALTAVAIMGIIGAIIYSIMKGRGRELADNLSVFGQGTAVAVMTRTGMKPAFNGMSSRTSLTMPYGVAIFAGVCVAGMGVYLWRT